MAKAKKKPIPNGLTFRKSSNKKFWWRVYKSRNIVDASTQGYTRLSQGAAKNYLSTKGYTDAAKKEVAKALVNYKTKQK